MVGEVCTVRGMAGDAESVAIGTMQHFVGGKRMTGLAEFLRRGNQRNACYSVPGLNGMARSAAGFHRRVHVLTLGQAAVALEASCRRSVCLHRNWMLDDRRGGRSARRLHRCGCRHPDENETDDQPRDSRTDDHVSLRRRYSLPDLKLLRGTRDCIVAVHRAQRFTGEREKAGCRFRVE